MKFIIRWCYNLQMPTFILFSLQNALLHQLREENTFLRQQLSTGLFENVHGTKDNNYPGLRKRLKQAASCIVRLSKDKQHLIELGNRLRAQITTTGQQGKNKRGNEQYLCKSQVEFDAVDLADLADLESEH